MNPVPAIALERLSYRYGSGAPVLAGVSLSVARGEVFGLLGNNGAGKSTLIKVITTLARPSGGSVRVLGLDPACQPAAVKRRIGVMPQENNLDTYLDVRRNLLFHCRFFGIGRRECAARTAHWMEVLGLTPKGAEPVLRLSGGTRRKVMLAKAFITEPELLVLDEPTTGLDPEVRAFVWQQIAAFRDRRRAVLLSTHYLEEAERMCDRVGILHQGAIAAFGRIGEPLPHAAADLDTLFRRVVGGAA